MSITKGEINNKRVFLERLKNYGTVYLGTPDTNRSAQNLVLGIDKETKQFLIERLSKQLKHDVEQYTSDLKEEVNKLIG